MAGLLDMFGGGPQAQGLLAAASQILQASGPSFRPTSLGQILGGGMQAGQEATQLARARDLQFRGAEADLAAQERTRAMQEQELAAARSAIRSPGQQAASLPGGPTAANAERIGEFQQQFDPDAYVAAMMQINPLRAIEIKKSLAKSGPEFDTKPQVATDDMGNVFQYLVAKDGTIRRLDGVKPRDELKLANLNDRDVAYNPYALEEGQTFRRGVSPDTRANNSVSMRGQNMTDLRARELNEITRQGQQSQLVNDPTQGPMLVDKGTGQARQVMMNGQAVPGETAAKKAAAGRNLMPLIAQADKLIDGATGSYLGAGADQAARWYGHATPGAQNIAQLRVLEGNIMMAQPRMEGPQSNMDVELYRQMAAQIGDPTVPNATKKAALTVLKSMYKKYAPEGANDSPGNQPGDITDLLNKYGGN